MDKSTCTNPKKQQTVCTFLGMYYEVIAIVSNILQDIDSLKPSDAYMRQ